MNTVQSFNPETKEKISKIISHLFKIEKEIGHKYLKLLVSKLPWSVTEDNNEGKKTKYDEQRYWSINAIMKAHQNIANDNKFHKNLRHEHSIPKKIIRNKIFDLEIKSEENIFEILDLFGHAAIVTVEEDKRLNEEGLRSSMPNNFKPDNRIQNIFSRYIECEIPICELDKPVTTINQNELNDLESLRIA